MSKEPTALIVSSDSATRERCKEMLSESGFGVVTAPDREAALAAFAQGGIDVVLARAPEVDGPLLLQAIRKHDDRLPVIFVTEWPDFSQVPVFASGSQRPLQTPAESLRSAIIAAAISYQVSRSRQR